MEKTRRALTGALIELVLAKRYDRITIQDLLDRADVGRSTFYAHYRGKDDLLFRSFEEMLRMLDGFIGPDDGRLAPVAELFHHVGAHRGFHRALVRAKVADRLFQAGVEHLSSTIGERLGASPESSLRARAMAGAAFALLRSWIEEESSYTPREMDEAFHAMWAERERSR